MIYDKVDEYDNEELSKMIDKYVKGETPRALLKRRIIDRKRFEPLAEEFNISVRHAQNIIYKAQEQLFKHL